MCVSHCRYHGSIRRVVGRRTLSGDSEFCLLTSISPLRERRLCCSSETVARALCKGIGHFFSDQHRAPLRGVPKPWRRALEREILQKGCNHIFNIVKENVPLYG